MSQRPGLVLVKRVRKLCLGAAVSFPPLQLSKSQDSLLRLPEDKEKD